MFGWLRRAPPPPTEEQLRMTEALVGYAPYAPPEWHPESDVAASKDYREFFLREKDTRLQALGAFLANFDVSMDLEDAGLMAVSAWLPHTRMSSSMISTMRMSKAHIAPLRAHGRES